MSQNLDWTQDLGDAVLAQRTELMDAAQRMRGKAYDSGNLKTTEQQVVTVKAAKHGCDPSYPTTCIPPSPPDLDCNRIAPRRFAVAGADPHGSDRDHDGTGCE